MTLHPSDKTADLVRNILTPPNTEDVERLIAWQQSLREAVDRHVAETLALPVSQEMENRFSDSSTAKREFVLWANSVFRRTRVCLLDCESNRAAFLAYSAGRGTDTGRVYLQLYGPEHNRTHIFRPPFQIQLVSIPIGSDWRDRMRRDRSPPYTELG